MAHIDRDGVKIHYETYGESGPAILLTHGFSETGEMWRDQIEALSASHRLILWDMRGHGRSDYPDDPAEYSEAKTVGDMAAILDAEGIDKAVIGGLSLGGYMSLAFYRDHPGRVAALIIVDSGPGMKNDEAREDWNRWARNYATQFEEQGLDALALLGGHSGGGAYPARTEYSSHRSEAGLIHAARGMLTQSDASVINSLPDIGVPTLIIVGEHDTPFIDATAYMERKIPGARRLVLAEAGHVANAHQPALFNRRVLEFLGEL